MALDRLGGIEVDAVDPAKAALPEGAGIAGFFGVDQGGELDEAGVGLRVQHGDAARGGHARFVQALAHGGQIGKGGGRAARCADAGGDVAVEAQAVGVDLFGQRLGGGLDKVAHEGLFAVQGDGGFDRAGGDVYGGQGVQGDVHGGFPDILVGNALVFVEGVGAEAHGLADLNGVAGLFEVLGKVAVDEVGEDQLVHQARQGAAGDGFEGEEGVGHGGLLCVAVSY